MADASEKKGLPRFEIAVVFDIRGASIASWCDWGSRSKNKHFVYDKRHRSKSLSVCQVLANV